MYVTSISVSVVGIADIIEIPHHKPINIIIINLQILKPTEKNSSGWILTWPIDISEKDMLPRVFRGEIDRDREIIFVNSKALKHLLIPDDQ